MVSGDHFPDVTQMVNNVPSLPSFDDQLRNAIRQWLAAKPSNSTRELSRLSGVAIATMIGWMKTPTRTIRMSTAESLANVLKVDLRTTGRVTSERNANRKVSFEEQLEAMIESSNKSALARESGVPLSTITGALQRDLSQISLSNAFALCAALQKDLLHSRLSA